LERAVRSARGPSSGAYCKAGTEVVGVRRILREDSRSEEAGRRAAEGQPAGNVSQLASLRTFWDGMMSGLAVGVYSGGR
jgi:hypothetical protein